MPHVEGAGVALHYTARGDGAPLLVVRTRTLRLLASTT